MATPRPQFSNDDRLPMLLGFQEVAANRHSTTRLIERGRGIYVFDTEGREYIEATASFYVASLGYQHEELIDAIEAQYRELPFYVSAVERTSKGSLELAERLSELVPVTRPHVLFASSGSEANDFMIKLFGFQAVARGTPHRRTVIGRVGSYAGGTLATASLTGGHHEEFGLPLAGFRHVSQPDYHGGREPGESPSEFASRLAHEIDDLLHAEPEQSVAALFAEPVSFSAGLAVPPPQYFPAIQSVLKKHDVDLVADEVITGFGRTGNWFGSQTMGFEPDHMVAAKGMTSGYFPLSTAVLGEGLYEDLERGSRVVGTLAHAATYAAHPVGAAAALKTIEIMERDDLIGGAARKGEYLANGLEKLRDHPLVGDVRSLGLAGAVDFLRRDEHDVPVNDDAHEIAQRVAENLLAAGVVARCTDRSIVIAPPLIIEQEELDVVCQRFAEALDAALE